jgi:phage terminase small subunit
VAGRPPKPKHLKVLHGDRKDRINELEPVPSELPVEPPYELEPEVQEVWDRLAPDRIAQGILTAWDVDAFAAFCESLVLARQGAREAGGAVVPGAPSPMSRFKDAVGLCTTLGSRFGWTPSDRQKPIIRCSCTAVWGLAKLTSCTRLATIFTTIDPTCASPMCRLRTF